jgi:hypothetical protein
MGGRGCVFDEIRQIKFLMQLSKRYTQERKAGGNSYSDYRNYLIIKTEHQFAPVKGENIMREEYIKEIVKLLEKCTDIQTLDLIHQLLIKKCQNA